MSPRESLCKTIGVALAAGALVLSAAATATAVPDESGPANPAVRDYLRTVNSLIDQVNSDAVSGPVDSELITQQIDIATYRLREALLTADPTR